MFESLENNLDAYLQELTDCIDFVATSSTLRPRLAPYVTWNAENLPKLLITNFLGTSNAKEQVIYRALYVSGHAAYEQFSRELLVAAADYISANIGPYDSLWDEIKKEHVFRTGQAMETIHQPLEHYEFDYHQLCTNIGGCIPGRPTFRLNSDALALIRGALTPENLEKVIRRLSVPFNWDSIASHAPLKACFQTQGTRALANEVKDFLDDMVKNRNRIAHSTGIAAEIGEAHVREQLRFIAAFCHALASHVKTEVTRKVNACARRR